MSDKEKSEEQGNDMAKSIWLAGLGAYGKVIGDATELYNKAYGDMPKRFLELVGQGKALEEQAKGTIHEKLGGSLSKTGHNIEERVDKMRRSLGFSSTVSQSDFDRLESKVDKVSKQLSQLTKELEKAKNA